MSSYREFHDRSIADREGFWAEQARLVHWEKPFSTVLEYRRPPFARWFVGGETNLCHNAVDRHLAARGAQKALIYISTETGEERSYTYRELHGEVNQAAAMIRALGVKKGDRVIVYMPMIPQALFAILVRRRRDQPLPQRGRPPSRGARRAEGADLHLDGDRRGALLHLPRAARRGEPGGRDDSRPRRQEGRPRHRLHADDPAGAVRDPSSSAARPTSATTRSTAISRRAARRRR